MQNNNDQNSNQNGNQNQPVNWGEGRGVRPKNSADTNSSFFDRAFKKLSRSDQDKNGGVPPSIQGVSVQQVGEGGGYTAPDEGDRNVRRRIEELQKSPLDFSAVREGSPKSASTTPTGAGAGAGGGVSPNGAGAGAGGGVSPNGAGAGGVAGAVTNQGLAPVTPPGGIAPLGNGYLVGTPGTVRM